MNIAQAGSAAMNEMQQIHRYITVRIANIYVSFPYTRIIDVGT